FDEKGTLRKDKNPAFDYCEARYWLAYHKGKVVGRVAGIVNHAFIQKWNQRFIRFGWLDFEYNDHVALALMKTVESWAKELNMEAVHGPLGFTDLDHEGMLVEGFDERGTIGGLYNFPYYPTLLEKTGYKKHTDWIVFRINIPETIDLRLDKLAGTVAKRQQLKILELKKTKDVLPYVPAIFELLNEAYADLYGVVPLTERQIRYYTKQYFSFIRPDFLSLVTDKEGRLAAFGITMPSLSLALQKANGSLLPFGFWHLLKAIRKNDTADLLLVAVRKDLQGKGVNALVMNEILKSFIKHGIRTAEASHQLEDNKLVHAMWDSFDAKVHKRRRCYIKYLNDEA
ncbi:MAG TPA: GNAT family N-acetyltransferase, partial [Flavisolibacter sp.]|nr:GNAT family N-acetyltransferase [Flavisolibacter sp.]